MPKISNGTYVYHLGKPNKLALVLDCINASEPEDIRLQGERYLVKHSGFVWSVPISALRVAPASRQIKSSADSAS